MSLDFYKAIEGFFTALFGVQYGEKGIIPGSLENMNGISSDMGFL